MKKVLVIIGFCLLAGYLVFSVFFYKDKPMEAVCSHFEIVTNNPLGDNMIDLTAMEKEIDAKGLNPYGKPLNTIDTYDIEQVIAANKMVKDVDVFITGSGGIKAEIVEREPILRVITSSGENYYIDKDGERVPLSKLFVADLPLATGAVTEEFAKTDLLVFAKFLLEDDFWNSQIEQIEVLSNKELKLIPRVGKHDIILGKIDGFQEKLDKLRTFYEKGLSQVGWNRYSTIDLRYNKQIVGQKR